MCAKIKLSHCNTTVCIVWQKMDTSSVSSKQSMSQDNETVLSLFKDLVVAQDMAVPVAAMNALVLKLKVRMLCPSYVGHASYRNKILHFSGF